MKKFNIELSEKEFEALCIALEKTPYLIDDELPNDWLKSKIISVKNLIDFRFIKHKDTINVFGIDSIAHVKNQDDLWYIIREKDKIILAVGDEETLKEYQNCDIMTILNGYYFGSDGFSLIAFTDEGPVQIYHWKDETDVNINSLEKK